MNDHNLDDLILGDPEPGHSGSKSLLSLIALILIILIVGVLLAKMLLSDPEESTKEAAGTNLTGVVAPKGPAAAPAEELPPELAPIRKEELPEHKALEPMTPTKPKTTPKPKPRPKATPKPRPKPKPAPTHKTAPKPKKPKPSELFKKSTPAKPVAPTTAPASTGKTYYIQVGSFKRMPDQRFLDKIKAQGYEPIIVKSGSMIKVRVGSYGSYAEAKSQLPVVKEKLGVDGFVVRKK